MALQTYRTYNDEALAKELVQQLAAQGIGVEVEDSKQLFDVTFASNPLTREIRILMEPGDFSRANIILGNYYKGLLDGLPADYYLFSFTDAELKDIVTKSEEWGELDYQLALRLLNERGISISAETAAQMKEQRYEELAQPEQPTTMLVVLGYLCGIALLTWCLLSSWHLLMLQQLGVGVLGFIVGRTLYKARKILPNGQSVYNYMDKDRMHGHRILLLAGLGCVVWLAKLVWIVISQ